MAVQPCGPLLLISSLRNNKKTTLSACEINEISTFLFKSTFAEARFCLMFNHSQRIFFFETIYDMELLCSSSACSIFVLTCMHIHVSHLHFYLKPSETHRDNLSGKRRPRKVGESWTSSKMWKDSSSFSLCQRCQTVIDVFCFAR